MRMGRQFIVCVLCNPMMFFAGRAHWINVDRSIGEIPQVMQKLVTHLLRNRMPLLHGQF